MKIQRNNKQKNLISILTVGYGLIFIVIDIFHYFYCIRVEKEHLESGIMELFHIPPESIELKIYSLFIHLILIFAGFFFYKRKAISWYLYNISFIAIILKLPISYFWGIYYYPNWIALTGLPYIISIAGLIYFNKGKAKHLMHYTKKRNSMRLAIISFFIFLVLSILSYNISWTPRKEMLRTLDSAITKNENSKYIFYFRNILDTLKVNWDNIHEIGIAVLNDSNRPIYIEKLGSSAYSLSCFPYIYDNRGNLIQEYDYTPAFNNIVYEYDTLNRLTTKRFCLDPKYFGYVPEDTAGQKNCCGIFHKYIYQKDMIEEIGFRSENDTFLRYELDVNLQGQVISRKVITGRSDEGDSYYFYDKEKRKISTEEYNDKGQLIRKELYYYHKGRLIRKEEFYYWKTDLSEKLLNLIKFKSYSSKYITYYFSEKELLTNKR